MDVTYDRHTRKFVEVFYSRTYIIELFNEEIGNATQSEIKVKNEQQALLGIDDTYNKIMVQEEWDRLQEAKPKKEKKPVVQAPQETPEKKKKGKKK